MRSSTQAWTSNHFEAFLNKPELFNYKPCLRHGDFGPGNILHDPQAQTINGIIDFDDIGKGDPAVDLAAVTFFGARFVERFYSVYPEVEAMQGRIQFYKGTFALQEALHGIKHNDCQAFESGMAEYV